MSSFKIKKYTDKDLKPKDIIKIYDSDFKNDKLAQAYKDIIIKSKLFIVKKVTDEKKGRCILCELPCIVLNEIPICAKNKEIFFRSLDLEV